MSEPHRPASARYLLDNQQAQAGERFDALSQLFNASTFRHMERLGIAPGWRVWEVGAGGPSVPAWLADRVGADGYVLATDIDTVWLPTEEHPGYDVLRHDVGAESVPAQEFDLVHARLVLVHVAEREAAIDTMISALRPGGWLLVEDADPGLQELVCPDESGPDQALANQLKRAFRVLLAERGVDLRFGRSLSRRLRDAGLGNVASDAYFPMGGAVCNELERATVEQVRHDLVSHGLATDTEIDEHLAHVASGQLDLATSPMISAWGQRLA
jgi:ubiquinone/menaquinone biosynthesis C-methylase UbiE